MKTKLSVPYREKDEAKALGAKFDMSGKYWYVPDGLDLASFKKWLPEELHAWLETKLPGKKKAKSPAKQQAIKNPLRPGQDEKAGYLNKGR